MPRKAEATPGLQQLARVFAIQLQVLNGADDLRVHISEHATQQWRRKRREFGWKGGRDGWKKNAQRKEGKDKEKKKTQKLGVIECQCYHHLRRAHKASVNARGGNEQQDGCRSDVEHHEIERRSRREQNPLFLFMYVGTLDHRTMLYTLYEQLHTCIHTFTHTKIDWSIWSWPGLLSHPFPCYCDS